MVTLSELIEFLDSQEADSDDIDSSCFEKSYNRLFWVNADDIWVFRGEKIHRDWTFGIHGDEYSLIITLGPTTTEIRGEITDIELDHERNEMNIPSQGMKVQLP